MNILELIESRRSIRKFTDKPVDDKKIQEILKAAMYAPSAGNARPWQFYIIKSRQMLSEIKNINPYAGMAEEAAFGILVCGDLSKEMFEGYWVVDCSAAVQNILLAVHSLGLGAVWTGVHPMEERKEEFRKLLSLPENIIPHSFIPVGYPDQEPSKPERFQAENIHVIE
ncbi:MAG: nitroreductase family protein [Spirochaetales bacterium]|nr:nitroreductase family protein [Spirochaetales bacterium]